MKLMRAVVVIAATLQLAGSAAETAAGPAANQLVFADTLVAPANAALDGRELGARKPAWTAFSGVTVTANGATLSNATPGGGHLAIPAVMGKITLRGELNPTGCGFAGLAFGHGNLSADFWKSYEVLFSIHEGGYTLLVGKTNLITKVDTSLVKKGFNLAELVLDTEARTITARLNGATVLDAKPFPAGASAQASTQAGFRFNEPVTPNAPLIRNFQITVESLAVAGLEPADIAALLVEPDQPATLRWTVAARGPSDVVPYAVSDYSGKPIASGEARFPADGALSLAVSATLPRGYYEIAFPQTRQTFGILALKPHEGRADPFFGIDAALTWLETRTPMRAGLAAILKRSGIGIARERLSMGSINPKPAVYQWQDGARQSDELRRIYRDAGVDVLEMLTGEPSHFEPGLNHNFSQNLVETASAWSAVTAHWGQGWAAGEVGNEPDLAIPGMPADQYVVMAKAAAYAADHTEPHRPTVAGVFASVPQGSYYDACTANGMLDCIDALSVHQYDRAPLMQGQVQAYREYVTAGGKPGLPVWITECGHPWVLGPSRPPLDQDRDSAREISAKAVEARACGVARYFPFCLPFYEEGGIKSFSMFGREVTPLRSFAAYAWCANALSGRDYSGDLRVDDPRVRLARVFSGPDGEDVAVLYTEDVDPKAEVRLPVAPLRMSGADGRALQPGTAGAFPVPDGLGYAWFKHGALGDALNTATPAAALVAASRQPLQPRATAAPVVLQFSYNAAIGEISKRAYFLTKTTAAALPLTVRLQNLGDAPLTITPTLHLPGAGSREFMHAPVTVAAHAIAEAAWTVDASTALDVCEVRLLRITAVCDQAPNILPLALPFLVEGERDEILARFPRQEPLPIAELKRWQVRVGGDGKQVFSSPDAKQWRMDLTFTRGGDAWAYPYFTMPKAIDPHTSSGVVLRGRVLKPGGRNIMLILVDGRNDVRVNDLFVPDGKWHTVYIPFDTLRYFTPGMQNEPLHLDRITTLGVGLCSSDLQQTMELGDVILVGAK